MLIDIDLKTLAITSVEDVHAALVEVIEARIAIEPNPRPGLHVVWLGRVYPLTCSPSNPILRMLWNDLLDEHSVEYRVWADGTTQLVEDGEPYSWMSDDFSIEKALDESHAQWLAGVL